jgi:hypothetical protein
MVTICYGIFKAQNSSCSLVNNFLNQKCYFTIFMEPLIDLQVGGRVMEALSKDLALQGVLPTQYMPPATSKEHHWGVQVRLWDQKCPRCSLPFADNILLKEGGVRIFPCSHAFHVACLGDFPNNCLQCKVNTNEMQ